MDSNGNDCRNCMIKAGGGYRMKRWFRGLLMMMVVVLTIGMGSMSAVAKKAEMKKGSTFTVGNLTYKVTSVNAKKKTVKVTVVGAKKNVKTVDLSKTVSADGWTLNVNAIGKDAFKGCKKLQTVKAGKTLKTIGKSAFKGCKKLKKLDISESSKLKSVGKGALEGASKVKVEVLDAKKISYYAEKLGVASSKIVETKHGDMNVAAAEPASGANDLGMSGTEITKETDKKANTEVNETPGAKVPAVVTPKVDEETENEAGQKEKDVLQTEASEVETPDGEEDMTEETLPQDETEMAEADGTPEETESTEKESEIQNQSEIPQANELPDDGDEIPQVTDAVKGNACSGGNHVFTAEWSVGKHATCAEWESLYRACECGKSMESTLGNPPTGNHVYVHQKVDSTCEKEGSEWDVCTGCGQKINVKTIPAKGGHQFVKVIDHDSSCDGSGYGHEECSICGKRGQGFNIPAGKHNWVIEDVASTCTTYGYTKRTCSNCGRSEEIAGTRKAKSEHTYVTINATSASCDSDGIRVEECSVCKHIRETVTEKRTGHSFGRPVTIVPSTCQHGGTVRYTCSKCSSTKDVPTPASGHRWVLNSNGVGIEKCADCGALFAISGGEGED